MSQIKVNAYISEKPSSSGWIAPHDSFPVNSWVGSRYEVLQCIDSIMEHLEVNGVTRLDVVFSPSHRLYDIGLNPRDLDDESWKDFITAVRDLAIASDTASLLLKNDYPAESQSLSSKVAEVLKKLD